MDRELLSNLLGWGSTLVLLATLAWQIRAQWRSPVVTVSRWLFAGQLAASCGFLAYSILLYNPVFIASNALLIVTALVGEWVVLHKRRQR